MKERPILFSAPMVRALLAGTKTQTRRICKLPVRAGMPEPELASLLACCPYGQPGDRLWVREAWRADRQFDSLAPRELNHTFTAIGYEAGGALLRLAEPGKLRPGMFMPRWASRITLEVTGVRVERLQDISQADAVAEGAPPSHPSIDAVSRDYGYPDFPRSWYAQLWDSINGPGSWKSNPWLWVVEFRRI